MNLDNLATFIIYILNSGSITLLYMGALEYLYFVRKKGIYQ